MTRRFVLVGAALAAIMALTSYAITGADNYVFEAIQPEVKTSNVAVLAVRLINKTTKKPVTNAIIVDTRIEMAPDE